MCDNLALVELAYLLMVSHKGGCWVVRIIELRVIVLIVHEGDFVTSFGVAVMLEGIRSIT